MKFIATIQFHIFHFGRLQCKLWARKRDEQIIEGERGTFKISLFFAACIVRPLAIFFILIYNNVILRLFNDAISLLYEILTFTGTNLCYILSAFFQEFLFFWNIFFFQLVLMCNMHSGKKRKKNVAVWKLLSVCIASGRNQTFITRDRL